MVKSGNKILGTLAFAGCGIWIAAAFGIIPAIAYLASMGLCWWLLDYLDGN